MSRRPAFATVDDLSEWLGDAIPSDTEDTDHRRASRCLGAASNLIRNQTGREWTSPESDPLPENLPEELADICLACAGRMFVNPNAETQWSLQADDGMDGGSRKVEESGLYLTATEKATLARLLARESPVIGGLSVIGTTRGESAGSDMHSSCDSDDGGCLNVTLTGARHETL